MPQLLLRKVRPMGRETVDVLTENGRIKAMGEGIQPTPDAQVLEGHGHLLLPGLVNAHAHVDKNLLGLPWLPNAVPGGRIRDFVDHERRVRGELGLSAREQAARQFRLGLATGTTHVRTHVDVDTEAGLRHLEGVLQAKADFDDLLTVQTVAFPQSGMLVRPGTAELLEEAAKLGADAVGGLDPCLIDRDPVRHLDTIFAIAERHGVELDIHLHEEGLLGAFSLELIAERTAALGMQGRVTVSHVFCLGMVDDTYLGRLTELLLENRITLMSLASGVTPFPPLKRLHGAGVAICTGTDGIRDTWGPWNSVDMLDRARTIAFRSGLRRDKDIDMVLGFATHGGARVMGDGEYGLEVGQRADLVVVPGEVPAEAVAERPPRTYVIKNGRLVAEGGQYIGGA
ncbi:MAG: amidohydrolase family protein [Meiothermus sp.]|nr:amidohydrolase family protein [Meiothermus sp.]